jgi:competence protein ComEC
LNYYGIDQLSLLIITHHDLDHMSGLPMLLDRGIERIISPEPLPLSNHRHAQHIQSMVLPHGQLRVIPPSLFFVDESRNNQSLLIQLSLSNWSFLFTGDMDELMEIRLINHHLIGSHHFLKLGHHGSRSSTSTELLMRVVPVLSWNSCGQNNRYGHPHSDVLNRLSNHHIPWLSTHVDGAILFKINPSKVMISSHVSKKVLVANL